MAAVVVMATPMGKRAVDVNELDMTTGVQQLGQASSGSNSCCCSLQPAQQLSHLDSGHEPP